MTRAAVEAASQRPALGDFRPSLHPSISTLEPCLPAPRSRFNSARRILPPCRESAQGANPAPGQQLPTSTAVLQNTLKP